MLKIVKLLDELYILLYTVPNVPKIHLEKFEWIIFKKLEVSIPIFRKLNKIFIIKNKQPSKY